MKFRDAESVIRKLARARARAMAPRGMKLSEKSQTAGRRCAETRRCGHEGRPIGQPNAGGEIVQRCPRCGTPWPMADVYQLAGQSHSGRGGRPSRAVLEVGDLALFEHRLKQARSLEPGHARVALMYWDPESGLSMKQLAEKLTSEGFIGQRWHVRDVRRAVERSGAVLERDLARRGVLDR